MTRDGAKFEVLGLESQGLLELERVRCVRWSKFELLEEGCDGNQGFLPSEWPTLKECTLVIESLLMSKTLFKAYNTCASTTAEGDPSFGL